MHLALTLCACLDETSSISFNEVDVVAFNAVAEIAACDAEGLPLLLAESESQQISQDAVAKALIIVFDNLDCQRLSQEAKLHALRAQYDHLAFSTDPGVDVINIDNLGTGNKIYKFPECVCHSWQGHPFFGKQHFSKQHLLSIRSSLRLTACGQPMGVYTATTTPWVSLCRPYPSREASAGLTPLLSLLDCPQSGLAGGEETVKARLFTDHDWHTVSFSVSLLFISDSCT